MPTAAVRLVLALIPLTLLAEPSHAQGYGHCRPGLAHADLDVNNVRARLFNGGNLFFNGGDPHYEVPKGSWKHAIFAASIWIGGLVDGELRTSAATYAQFGQDYEFFPGPLDAQGNPPPGCTRRSPYDRIWTVSRADIAHYENTGIATEDLAEWPADFGAPFFDMDGDGTYDLEAGDRPKVYGEQTAWWVMNDVGGPHRTTLSEPIGLEARVTAFAAMRTEEALRNTTFYRYDLTYYGETPLDSTYFTFFVDPDLGSYDDDYIGSDTTLDLGFVYNAANDDVVYGEAPPAQGVRWVETPDDLGMTVFGFYWGGSGPQTGEPHTKEAFWNYMRGRWRDGSPMTVGGFGTGSFGEPTTFAYPNSGTMEDPEPGYWSEVCPDPNCSAPIPPDDRRFHTSTGPFRMEPGQTRVVSFALVWARGEDHFDSLQQMKRASMIVEQNYRLGVLDPAPPSASEEPSVPPDGFGLAVYPRPFRDAATVRVDVPERAGALRVSVFDVLGREVAVLAEGGLAPGEHALTLDGTGLPSGLYLVRLETVRQAETLKLVHVE